MDSGTRECIEQLSSTDDKVRLKALQTVLKVTEGQVDWVYEIWDDLIKRLDDANSYQRSIAIMVVCNLAKSDVENRLKESITGLLKHTKDEKFITSRQCIQNLWKIAAVNSEARDMILKHLEQRFAECAGEKHYNLIRQDIVQTIRCLYDHQTDGKLLEGAESMIRMEKEQKYQRKYHAILSGR